MHQQHIYLTLGVQDMVCAPTTHLPHSGVQGMVYGVCTNNIHTSVLGFKAWCVNQQHTYLRGFKVSAVPTSLRMAPEGMQAVLCLKDCA